ncbi:hypothetical protein CEXT_185621 [Caerostris extrusa]|uniref:Uncharacterized protein n=1 Tax=Caerostris extrusa TaxID=172846 RepID=A0AAV4SCF8_CAEEX|nr:hypothetical protein CEXT_185621 [Caerostris extrusa]
MHIRGHRQQSVGAKTSSIHKEEKVFPLHQGKGNSTTPEHSIVGVFDWLMNYSFLPLYYHTDLPWRVQREIQREIDGVKFTDTKAATSRVSVLSDGCSDLNNDEGLFGYQKLAFFSLPYKTWNSIFL